MKREDRLLFICTRQHFLPEHRKRVLDLCANAPVQWDYIYKTAYLHGVAPLVASNLLTCASSGLSIPRQVVAQFLLCREQSIAVDRARNEKLSETLSYFQKHAIDVMLIKGAALNIFVYQQPWYTTSEDIDVILRTRKEELTGTSDEEIVELFRPLIEHDYFEHHDLNLNGILPIDFQELWENASKTKCSGHEVFVLSPEDMLISVCVNSARKRFFMLKNMCDVAEVIAKQRDLNIDLEKMVEKARIYKCNNIVYTALLVAKMCLKSHVPDQLLTRLSVHPFKARIIRYLIGHLSFSSLSELYSGRKFLGRHMNPSILLPGLVYRWDQIWSKARFVWESRTLAQEGWRAFLPKGARIEDRH